MMTIKNNELNKSKMDTKDKKDKKALKYCRIGEPKSLLIASTESTVINICSDYFEMHNIKEQAPLLKVQKRLGREELLCPSKTNIAQLLT